MFSYRHAFHAGNHADVLKHTVLIAILKHLREKDSALVVLDTHAGAGLYRLDGDYATTSGEAADGVLRLMAPPADAGAAEGKKKPAAAPAPLAPALQDYLDTVASFNPGGAHRVYPGSPFIIQSLLGERDRLKLFELHPTDAKTLGANIAQLEAGRTVAVLREDGFEGIKKFLPPPSRRGLVPDALLRFATGTYVVWYPIIPRPEAHDLPKKLKTLALRARKAWLHATLTVKNSKLLTDAAGEVQRPGLPASGMFVINPPHTLKAALTLALPQMVERLAQDKNAGYTLDSGG